MTIHSHVESGICVCRLKAINASQQRFQDVDRRLTGIPDPIVVLLLKQPQRARINQLPTFNSRWSYERKRENGHGCAFDSSGISPTVEGGITFECPVHATMFRRGKFRECDSNG